MFTNLFMLVGGIAALVAAAVIFRRKTERFRHWLSASGIVTELIPQWREQSRGGRTEVFSPRISFRTASGESVEFISSESSKPAIAAVGQTLRVRYDPANPQEAMIDSLLSRHMAEILLLTTGLSLVTIFIYERFAV